MNRLLQSSIFLFLLYPVLIMNQKACAEIEKNRVEQQYIYEHLEPDEVYHPWHSLYVNYYRFQSSTFYYFISLGSVYREHNTDFIATIGGSKDWTDRFNTYSALSMGSNVDYLPRYRIDHELNFKLGRERNIVWTFGVAYVDYHYAAEDFILSTGPSLYYKEWVWSYRLFRNQNMVGDIVSYTHLFKIGYGEEKRFWLYFDYSKGSQAYLALHVTEPEEKRENAFRVSLNHRHWIGRNIGFFVDLSYLDLKDEYEVYGASLSLFIEF